MSARWTRVARGSLAAAFSTFVAAFSHAVSGGSAPGVAALSLAVAFSTLVCVALAGRGLSYWRIGASVAVSQIFFHTLFSLIVQPAAASPSAPTMAHAGHDMAAMFLPAGAAASGASITVDVAMVTGHVLAAVATFAAIVWGERAARGLLAAALVRATRFAALLLPAPVFLPRAVRLGRVARIDAPAVLEVLRASVWHRGPPLAA